MPLSSIDVRSVPERIAEIARFVPHFIALSDGASEITFQQLDSMADDLAAVLQQRGVTRGSTVALCLERSFDWIVSALGILRSGAAYVPLDSVWPDARLRFSIEDSGATVLVARRSLSDRLALSIQAIDPALLAPCMHSPDPVFLDPEDIAYVIYTSGSTGVPKGVEVTHANLMHLVQWHCRACGVTCRDRVSHLAGLGFDAAVWEIWPNLCAEATVCLAADEVRSSPELLQQWLMRERITISFVPTVHALPLAELQWPPAPALRLLLTGGDKLHRAPSLPLPFAMVNNYGPAECTVVATSGVVDPRSVGPPAIGNAVARTAVYLLNESGHPVAGDEVDEIFVGGEGVARGYRNLPALTRQHFLPDPFSNVAGARMYRTGDFGRRRPDGQIEFCGRRDRQVKLRGQRIELDEIDTLLNRHRGVKFAVTLLVNAGATARLVTYILPLGGIADPTARQLQEYLQESIPGYMVPAVFVRIESIPVSANGKIDISRLPLPEDAPPLSGPVGDTSGSPLEEQLLVIVRDLLEKQTIGRDDNFFLAGGHSLLGMQFVIRLQKTFGVELSLQDLFRAPTVRYLAILLQHLLDALTLTHLWQHQLGVSHIGPDQNLAELGADRAAQLVLQQRIALKLGKHISTDQLSDAPSIRQQTRLLQAAPAVPKLPSGVLEVLPKSSHKLIFWIHYQNVELARAIGDDMTFLSVVLTVEDLRLLEEAPTLQDIARRLVPKILETQPAGPYVIGGLCIGGVLAYEVAHQLRNAGKDVSLLVLLDPPTPAYLRLGPTPAVDFPYLRYLFQRAARLGPRVSARYFRERLNRTLAKIFNKQTRRSPGGAAQKIIEGASFNYSPAKYHGKVLLLLASERPPSVNFLPGWQAVIPSGLNAQYVNGHHRDLLGTKTVQDIADAIKSRLSLSVN